MENITLIYGLVIIVLIIISGYFAFSETALTTASEAKIHRLSKEGNKRAKKVEKLFKNRDTLMGTLLLGNNVVNILASAMATSVFIKIFGESGVFYATFVMTFLVLIFGEIAPKTYALKHPERLALRSAPFLLIVVTLLNPITRGIQTIIDATINFFSTDKVDNNLISDLDEIRGTIELKHKEGTIFKYDKDMIDGILDLGEMEIGDILIHRKNIESINIEQDLKDIIKQAFDINHSRIPLWKGNNDNIEAVLEMRELIKVFHQNQGDISKINLSDIAYKPWFVPSTNTLRSQLFAFRKKKKKFAVVIDEYSALVGIVTVEDILEQIVGNLNDKENDKQHRIIKMKKGGYKIFGEMLIRDINRKLHWNLPEDDKDGVSTLAGLAIAKLERIPEAKEEFEIDGYSFKILKKEQNRIIMLKVKKLESNFANGQA